MRSVYEPHRPSLPPRSRTALDKELLVKDCGSALLTEDPNRRMEGRPSLATLLSPLSDLASRAGSFLRESPVGEFHSGQCLYRLPRFIFRGPHGGSEPIRLGLFAAIHGDEPEGALALVDFLKNLVAFPDLARGYELYVYPVCNPTGFEDGTRHSRTGLDLNREFWKGSIQPEIYYLERELGVMQFAGLVSLHSDDTADGLYAYVRGATLTEALAKPVLTAAAQFLPLAAGETIDGFTARNGLIAQCFEGVLSNPVELRPLPFEIIFETPQRTPQGLQIQATVAALEAVLREYRQFLAYAQDL